MFPVFIDSIWQGFRAPLPIDRNVEDLIEERSEGSNFEKVGFILRHFKRLYLANMNAV